MFRQPSRRLNSLYAVSNASCNWRWTLLPSLTVFCPRFTSDVVPFFHLFKPRRMYLKPARCFSHALCAQTAQVPSVLLPVKYVW